MNKMLFLLLFGGTVLMMVVMAKTGSSLNTTEAPHGILSLELANTSLKTSRIINQWRQITNTDVVYNATLNTWLDFIFIFFYSFLLFYCCRFLTANSTGWLNNIGHKLTRASLITGLFDIFENTGMFISLYGNIFNTNSFFTAACAFGKWLIVIFAISYIVIAGAILLYEKTRKT